MDSVMYFVNISAIHHAIQTRQTPHYQTIKYLERENVRDVRDKKGKNLAQAEKMILHSSFAYSE